MFISKVDPLIIFSSFIANKIFFSSWRLLFKFSGLEDHLLKLYPNFSFNIFLHTFVSIQTPLLFIKFSLTSLHVNDRLQFWAKEAIAFHILSFWKSLLLIFEWNLVAFLFKLKIFYYSFNCWVTNLWKLLYLPDWFSIDYLRKYHCFLFIC